MTEKVILFSPAEKVDFAMVMATGTMGEGGGVVSTGAGSPEIDLGTAGSGGFTPFPGGVVGSGGGVVGSTPAPTPAPTPTPGPTPIVGTTTGASTSSTGATGTIAKLMDGTKGTATTTIEQGKDIVAQLSSNILWAILFVIGAAFAGYLFVAKK